MIYNLGLQITILIIMIAIFILHLLLYLYSDRYLRFNDLFTIFISTAMGLFSYMLCHKESNGIFNVLLWLIISIIIINIILVVSANTLIKYNINKRGEE